MDKLKARLAKQRQAADDDGRQMLAKRDPVATVRAGIAAMTAKQRADFLKELQAELMKK